MKKPVFILIHGFGGNVAEVTPLADLLNQKGFPTLCPPLKGHTGLKSDLSKTTYQDWINSVEEPLVKAQEEYEKLVLVGFSMGGLIAVRLAELSPNPPDRSFPSVRHRGNRRTASGHKQRPPDGINNLLRAVILALDALMHKSCKKCKNN